MAKSRSARTFRNKARKLHLVSKYPSAMDMILERQRHTLTEIMSIAASTSKLLEAMESGNMENTENPSEE